MYDTSDALRQRLKREREEREWTEKERVATEKIVRLEKEIEKIAKNYDQLERERLEKEKQSSGWWGFFSSLGGSAETAKKRAIGEARFRDIQTAMLKDQLMSLKYDKAEVQRKRAEQERENKERGARAREAKEAFARQQEEIKKKEATRRAAQEKERQAREARQEAVAARQKETRETEIRERDLRERLRREMEQASTTSAARQKATREMEIHERDLRELLRRKLDGQANPAAAKVDVKNEKAQAEATQTKAEAAQPSSHSPNPHLQHHPLDGSWRSGPPSTSHPTPQPFTNPETNPTPRTAHARQRGPPKPKAPTGCSHRPLWPKVQGRHQCSVCSRWLPKYIFQCDWCGVRACNDCRKTLKT